MIDKHLIDKQQKKALEYLLDSYENSKTFRGDNRINQSFSVSIGKLFPRYCDDAEYDFFCMINDAMNDLKSLGLIKTEYEKNGVLKKIILNPEQLGLCYELLDRLPRRKEQEQLAHIWQDVCPRDDAAIWDDGKLAPLMKYIDAQRIRVQKNQNVEYFHQNLKEYRDLILAVKAVLENQEEQYIRNFSIQLFHDSKRMEQLQNAASALLFQYGEYQEKDTVLEECGIVKTPTYVTMKGNGKVRLGGQMIDLSLLLGDIALSTESLKSLETVTVLGERVVTVENLTSFHDYPLGDDFVIYLGGFHNQVKRNFLTELYQQNTEIEYCHFGDIDAGGFCIYEHLKRKTGIPFHMLYMDASTLRKYASETKPLTGNDRKRLLQLKEGLEKRTQDGDVGENYVDVIEYMLEGNCKLEQEAVNVHKE